MSCTNTGNTMVCTSSESDSDGIDLRTRKGQEDHVLKQIKDHGGFSIFWATATSKRAHAVDRLIEKGKIIRGKDKYPWCNYIISEDKK